jgi:hypothetical protein
MYLQSIKSVKHIAAKSVDRSILKKGRHLGFGVFLVNSSMPHYMYTDEAENVPFCPNKQSSFSSPVRGQKSLRETS